MKSYQKMISVTNCSIKLAFVVVVVVENSQLVLLV